MRPLETNYSPNWQRLFFLPKDKLVLSPEAVSDSIRYASRRHSHPSDVELESEVLSVTACALVSADHGAKFVGYTVAGNQIIEEVQS